MKDLPKGGLIGKTARTLQALDEMNIGVHAANASYFIILAVFPALVLLLSALRYTPVDVHVLVEMVSGVIPTALMPTAEKLIVNTYDSTSGAMLSISAVTALWSASRGIFGLLTGLNTVYAVSEDRGWLYTRFISVAYTFVFIVLLLLTLVLQVYGTPILELLEDTQIPLLRFALELLDLRSFILLFLQTGVFTLIFMVFPNKRNTFMESIPGALLSAIGWQVFSHLYSLYVEHFPSYANIYGSVYVIAITMLWLYFCISIVFYGGALNYFLIDRKERQGK